MTPDEAKVQSAPWIFDLVRKYDSVMCAVYFPADSRVYRLLMTNDVEGLRLLCLEALSHKEVTP